MHTHVVDNLSFYLVNGLINQKAARHLLDTKDSAIKKFLPYTNAAVDGMGNLHDCPNMFGPIARNYVAFNA